MKTQGTKDNITTIWQAIEKDDAEKLGSFNDNEINQLDENGLQTIHFAASKGAINCLQYLINEKGVNVSGDYNREGKTPMHFAARHGQVQAIEFLLKNGADIEAVDYDGLTPMHQAAGNFHAEAIKCLLDNGADIEASNSKYGPLIEHAFGTIMMYVAEQHMNKINMIEYNEDEIAIRDANVNCQFETIKCLFENGSALDMQDYLESGNNGRIARIYNNAGHKKLLELMKVVEVLQKICELQNDGIDPLLFDGFNNSDKKDELESFAIKFMTNYLIKHGIPDNYQESFEESIKVLPGHIASTMQLCINELLSASTNILETLEGEMRQLIDGISNMPYSSIKYLHNQSSLSDSEQAFINFYETHPDYKVPGNYLKHVLGLESEFYNIPLLNYIMLVDENISFLTNELYQSP